MALVAAFLTLLVAGCATYVWKKSGASPGQVTEDRQECDRQARLLTDDRELAVPTPGGWRPYDPSRNFPAGRLAEEQRVFSACMRAKGYVQVKQSQD
jgi:hypothetical protein